MLVQSIIIGALVVFLINGKCLWQCLIFSSLVTLKINKAPNLTYTRRAEILQGASTAVDILNGNIRLPWVFIQIKVPDPRNLQSHLGRDETLYVCCDSPESNYFIIE